jgi:cyclohexanone monooxygenase
LVDDGWTDAVRSTPGFFGTGSDNVDNTVVADKLRLADFRKMEYIRRRVDSIVQDKNTAAKLKPYYQQFCKRPCFHDEYLPAFNRSNVTLVDTNGRGVEEVTTNGIVANNKEIELDCIIYATGFDFGGDFSDDNGKIVGRGAVSLSEAWREGPSTFHGWAVHGFPNMFILGPTQSAPNPNWTHSMVEMGTHFLYVYEQCLKRNIRSCEASRGAEESWVRTALDKSDARKDFLMQCTPGYYNNEGALDEKTLRAQPYGGGGLEFTQILKEWRRADDLAGIVLE